MAAYYTRLGGEGKIGNRDGSHDQRRQQRRVDGGPSQVPLGPPMDLANALAQYQMQLVRGLRCDPAPTFLPNVCTYAARGYSVGSGFLTRSARV